MATLHVKVVPGASRNRLAGRYGQGVKVQVSAPPERGKANEAVVEVLAAALSLSPRQVTIAAGHGQPRKTICIDGLDQAALDARLAELLD